MKNRLTAPLIALGTAVFVLPGIAAAEQPNIEPGLWEYENEFIYEAAVPIPDRSATNQECVTLEDVQEGYAFLDDEGMDGCEMTHLDLRSDGMDYTLECKDEGIQFNMDASMEFRGDSASGLITGEMETPMGPVSMRVQMEGRRIGDC